MASMGLQTSASMPSVGAASSTTKHLSATQQRKLELSQDPYWRNQKSTSTKQLKKLETLWNSRHQLSFASQLNTIMSRNCRDYFDRPRELPKDECSGMMHAKERYRPTWSLTSGYKIQDRPLQSGRSCSLSTEPKCVLGRMGWDDRHHVTYSSANQFFHDNDREYFGLFLNKRSERVLQPKHRGLTYHYKPLFQPGNPDGVDEGLSPAELLMQNGRATFMGASMGAAARSSSLGASRAFAAQSSLTAPAGFHRAESLSMSIGSQVPGRPDASFDGWGEQ